MQRLISLMNLHDQDKGQGLVTTSNQSVKTADNVQCTCSQ